MAFLRNTWYVAAWTGDVTRALTSRTILGDSVLLYRKENGDAVAIGNRCPHRFAPLDLGRLVGDNVECGYHGLQFDAHGACAFNPHGDGKIPAKAQVKRYPIVEKDDLVWIWTGDVHRADPAKVPAFAHLVSPDLKTIGNQLTLEADYRLMIDNLMDLTHINYLHAPYQKIDEFLTAKHEVVQQDQSLMSLRTIASTLAPLSFRPFLDNPDAPVEYWLNIRWDAPSACQLEVGVVPVGRPQSEGIRRIGSHIVTPETETTSRYFYASSRNYRLNDPAADNETNTWQQVGFHQQDKPMLEAVQMMMGTTDLDSLVPVLLPSDVAAVRVRRMMSELIRQESPVRQAIPIAEAVS